MRLQHGAWETGTFIRPDEPGLASRPRGRTLLVVSSGWRNGFATPFPGHSEAARLPWDRRARASSVGFGRRRRSGIPYSRRFSSVPSGCVSQIDITCESASRLLKLIVTLESSSSKYTKMYTPLPISLVGMPT